MGFEGLAAEIRHNAEAEGRKIVRASEGEAARMTGEARKKAEAETRAARKDAEEYVKEEASEGITAAKLAAKKMLDDAKDDAVKAGVEKVWEKFREKAMAKSAYPGLLARLVKEGMDELGMGDAVIRVRNEDSPLVQGFRTAKLGPESSGGAIIESADGKIRVDKTLEEVFAQKRGGLRKQVFEKLF